MAKRARRPNTGAQRQSGHKSSRRRQNTQRDTLGFPAVIPEVIEFPGQKAKSNSLESFRPKTPRQADYADSISTNTLSFGIGPAGVGKTYVAVSVACMKFLNKEIDRMIFSRPALGADEELGFFKGDINEKIAPWVAPIREILNRHLGASHVELLIKRDVITFQPFATMRGHSWPRTFIMLDEAQNTTPKQMKLFLTRTGEDSIVVVDGDVSQKDINERSGLEDAMGKLKGRPSVGAVTFTVEDIVRSGFVKMVLEAYS